MKQRYKQTDIGVVPEDWETTTFQNCFRVLPNNTLSRAELNENEGTVKNIHYGDILTRYGAMLNCSSTSVPYITNPDKYSCAETLADGDLVIADTAEDETVGKAVEISRVKNQRIVSGLHTIPCRTKEPVLFAEGWLGYYINSSFYHNQLLPLITGTKVSAISKAAISDTIILIPPFSEQQRISEALSDLDELITSLEKLIAKKNAVKQGAMQELLTGKRRLPGFCGEWETVSIGECGFLSKESVNPLMFPSEYFWEYSMPAFDENKRPLRQRGDNMHSNRIRIAGDVLLFNKLNVRQKRIWLVNNCPRNSVCSSEFLPYYSDVLDLRLLKYILGTDKATNDFVGMSTGTSNSQKRITPDDFLEYTVLIPRREDEQHTLADALECMEEECAALENQLNKAYQIKQGMMQQLLTGKIRLV